MSLKVVAAKDKKMESLDDLSEYIRKRSGLKLSDLDDITIQLNARLRTEFSGETQAFLFDSDSGKIFALNTTAAFIFSKIKENLSLAAIIKQLVAEFDVDQPQAISDLQNFIYQLRELGIGLKE